MFLLAHGFATELDSLGVVDQAIENGVGEGRVLELAVPEFDRELTGDEYAAALLPVFEQFEQQRLVVGRHRHEAEVVEDDEVDTPHRLEPLADATLRLQRREFFSETRQAQVAHGLFLIDYGLGQRASEVTLADAGGADQQDVLMLLEPVEADELLPAALAETARRAQVDIGRMGTLPEPSELESSCLGKAVAVQALSLEQDGERVDDFVSAGQSCEGIGGAAQAEADELLLQGFMQHGRSR